MPHSLASVDGREIVREVSAGVLAENARATWVNDNAFDR
jgi:hypothetical protein